MTRVTLKRYIKDETQRIELSFIAMENHLRLANNLGEITKDEFTTHKTLLAVKRDLLRQIREVVK